MDDVTVNFMQALFAGIKATYIILLILIATVIILIIKKAWPITSRNINDINDLKNKRKAVRKQHQQSVLLSENESFKEAELTFTLNISDTGCFLCTARKWEKGDPVWMKNADSGKIKTGIIRRIQLSEDNQTTGIGIEYL